MTVFWILSDFRCNLPFTCFSVLYLVHFSIAKLNFMLLRRRQAHRKGPQSILQNLVEQQEAKAPQVALLHQLFAFIGSSPERAVSIIFHLSIL